MNETARKHNHTRHKAALFLAPLFGLVCALIARQAGQSAHLVLSMVTGTLLAAIIPLMIMRGRSCPDCGRVNARLTVAREELEAKSRHNYVYFHRCKFCKDTWTRRG